MTSSYYSLESYANEVQLPESMLKWAQTNGCESRCDLLTVALRLGNLDVVEHLYHYDQSWTWSTELYCDAAEYGHLHIIEWVIKHTDMLDEVCNAAALGGHLHILRWLDSKGYKINKNICEDAAISGSIEVLKWLREKGFQWDELTFANAVNTDHFELIKWLHAEGCSWDEYVYSRAVQTDNPTIMQWFCDNGCPYDEADMEYSYHAYGVKVK
jgi:hypothetical protein